MRNWQGDLPKNLSSFWKIVQFQNQKSCGILHLPRGDVLPPSLDFRRWSVWLLPCGYGGFRGHILLPRLTWQCGNIDTGGIGLNLNYIRTAVGKKNKKAANYDWQFADEKWLLIVAEGNTLSEHAGPSEEREWNDSELRTLCCASPFDRIYFWERGRRWYKSLKPDRRIVRTLPN